MRVLFGEQWIEGLADYHRQPGDVRVEVVAAGTLERLAGLYPVRSNRDLRMVWNYARAIGIRDTLRKVASRSSERFRNCKFVSCGLGRVLEAADAGGVRVGQPVVFLLPTGPACAERLVLPEAFLLPLGEESLPPLPDGEVLFAGALVATDVTPWWEPFRGWSPESGHPISRFAASVALKEAQRLLLDADWSRARSLPASRSAVSTVLAGKAPPRPARRKTAVLFGYGNYAKTIILPRIGRNLHVERVHEIDPTQIPLRRRGSVAFDTSPDLGPDESPDAVLVAGYHHTHTALACEALRRGAAVVVEKPIATTRAQLEELVATLRETGGALFSGYQRRYLPFNDWVREDLGVGPEDPVSYHAIVYEVPLAELHWYRWQNSRSRLLSNGCHWIDHFLHLNGYRAPSELDVRIGPDGALNCSVSLDNGAFFTMVLTDRGSRRLGVQDHVEIRASGATVRIEDVCTYQAENDRRILRRRRIRRLEAYRRMYDEIGRKIAAGEPGESLLSVQRSASLVLDLEERLAKLVAEAPAVGASAGTLDSPDVASA